MSVITKVTTYDFRFPTSATFSGSDAMNPDPDYSSAYVVIATDAGDSGNGFVFTIGRGNDVVVRASTPCPKPSSDATSKNCSTTCVSHGICSCAIRSYAGLA